MPVGSIGYNVFILFLCIKSTLDTTDFTGTANLRQFGPRLDFNAPSLIIGEVQVQRVEFVVRQRINVFFDLFYREKMSGDVQHGTTVAKFRGIHYLARRNYPHGAVRQSVIAGLWY